MHASVLETPLNNNEQIKIKVESKINLMQISESQSYDIQKDKLNL